MRGPKFDISEFRSIALSSLEVICIVQTHYSEWKNEIRNTLNDYPSTSFLLPTTVLLQPLLIPRLPKPCSNHYFLRVLCALFEHLLHELWICIFCKTVEIASNAFVKQKTGHKVLLIGLCCQVTVKYGEGTMKIASINIASLLNSEAHCKLLQFSEARSSITL